MIFYSSDFTFNNCCSHGSNIHLVSEDSGVLNNYGIPFNVNEKDNEVTLSFCYAEGDKPLEWDYDTTTNFLEWMITEDFCEFISEDNEGIIYFLKGIGYTKRFTNRMTGIIDVTFKMLSPYGYKNSTKDVYTKDGQFEIYNQSNIDNAYKPVIKLSNITTSTITLTNKTTNKPPFIIENLTNSDVIYIDNMMGTITDDNGKNRLADSNRNWIELCKGSNIFTIDGNCNMRVESYFPMMV